MQGGQPRPQARGVKVSHLNEQTTVKPLNSGHIGGRPLSVEAVVPILEVDQLATPPILSSLIGFDAEGCGLQEASHSIKHALHGQKSTKKKRVDRLSE